jgi:transposase
MTERELDERDLALLDVHAEGATIGEIAELFDVDREYVARLVREAWGDGED